MFASVLLLGSWIALGLPAAMVALPWTLLSGDPGFLYWIGIGIVRMGLRVAGVRVKTAGGEEIPRGVPCLYIANHQSNLDPPLLASVQPDNSAMMVKQSLMKIPIFGTALRLAKCVPVNRSGGLEAARQSVRAASDVLHSGLSITVFPEGTRSVDERLLPFKKGPFFIAMQTGVPVIPVTISGTGRMLGKGALRLRYGTAQVTFHAALDPRQFASRDQLLEAVRAAIASALPPSSGLKNLRSPD